MSGGLITLVAIQGKWRVIATSGILLTIFNKSTKYLSLPTLVEVELSCDKNQMNSEWTEEQQTSKPTDKQMIKKVWTDEQTDTQIDLLQN